MEFSAGKVNGTWLLTPSVFRDSRGTFHETFRESELEKFTGVKFKVVQSNQSSSHKGALRGIHWTDSEQGQSKLVFCSKGAVWDVVVDMRPGSETFGKWDAVFLSSEKSNGIFIPKGIGHAFLAVQDDSVVNYLCDFEYDPIPERQINPLSPSLAIPFQDVASEFQISRFIMSEKDSLAADFHAKP